MVKYNEVKLSYSCPAFPPDGVDMSKAYNIIKKDDKFYFTDGVTEFEGDLEYIKMLFTPNGNKIDWKDVDFSEKLNVSKTFCSNKDIN